MPIRHPTAVLLALLPALTLGGAAMAQTAAPSGQTPASHPPAGQAQAAQAKDPTTNPADRAFIDAFRDGMMGMHRSMPIGDTDGDFARLMMPQDTSTLEMAKAELKYGQDPGLKAIAQQIVDGRDKEMAALREWQGKHPGQ